jgi:predicted dehydrogenase
LEKNKKNRESNKKLISRRKFIKNSALGAAGLSIVPRHVLGGKGYTAPSDKLYIACVGCGNMGHATIEQVSRTPENKAVIAYLCDVDDRQAGPTRKQFPKAKFYHDWRELFSKEHNHFDAVTVAIPDHNHAIVGLNAMKLRKHLYLQKPLTHDIYEARVLTRAAKKYKVVTQMGNQLASTDGVRKLKEWFDANLIGDIQKIYNWTNRPTYPQGLSPWTSKHPKVPKALKWDLWQGTAKPTKYVPNLVPEKWRAWWDYGTGSLGDMGCHIMGPTFKLLGLGYPTKIAGESVTIFSDWGKEAYYPKSAPPSSKIRYTFERKDGREIEFYWYDGGMLPPRPPELDPDVNMNKLLFSGYFGATIFKGTRGTIVCGEGGLNPRLLPISLTKDIDIPQKYPRVKGGADGHYWQWVEAAIAGYHNDYEGNAALPVPGREKAYVDSPIVGYAGPLTETILMGNLLLRSFNIRHKTKKGYEYPGRYIEYLWDGPNMRITNFKPANQFVKREYRKGWGPLKI